MPCQVLHDADPFDEINVTRVLDDDGEPTAWVDIEGLRQVGMREARVRYVELLDQAEIHLEHHHGKGMDAPMSFEELAHATTRANVAFLVD